MNKLTYLGILQIVLGLMLSGCHVIQGVLHYEGGSTAAARTQSNPFQSVKFPLESCGDSLPEDPQAYPLELYTVFIDDSQDWQEIQKQYCGEASFAEISQKTGRGRDIIQVGTFISKQRAEYFRETLSGYLDKVFISEATIITADSVNESSGNSSEVAKNFNTPLKVSQAALLSEQEFNNLLSIDRSESFHLGRAKDPYKIKVILPTYIPKGFELASLRIDSSPSYGNAYFLRYKNPMNNQCFIFRGGFIQPIGGPPVLSAIVKANSPALGQTTIAAHTSEKKSGQVSSVGFYRGLENRLDFGQFEFSSPGYGHPEPCEPMSFVEAVKVAESFQFLQP
ncbi:hypothetical protein [Planktothrix agardhii]|uniref:hypothetical protein n=1 Tax=Planktothrix agardhii TaxID=1160 RepID=UPI001F477671|nr:hypothetical protein [Planktothrix agardhii]MCF3578553.1 hypothetical protein [Planktothrix agardhii 1812]MCF3583316.1 hypothetical protein [Planktothrix agardhii 1811]